MKALVTGGAGFIGSHLAARLLEEGLSVVVLDDLSNGCEANVPKSAAFVRGSAGDANLLDGVLPECSCVFHLAADSSVSHSIAGPLAAHANNLTITLELLEAAVRNTVPRFVFSSSAAVYGETGPDPVSEDADKEPLSHYAVQKLASENYCKVYKHLHDLETVSLRYFNVYGPNRREGSPHTGVVSKFIASASCGKPIVISGDGLQTRDFVHVDDVVTANIAALKAERSRVSGEVFNIGSGESVSVKELALIISEKFSSSSVPHFGPPRAGEIVHSRADISRAREVLSFTPQESLSRFLDSISAAPDCFA